MASKILKKSKLARLVLAFLTVLVFGGLVCAGAASAATYYISPSGSDSSAGTNASPWGTFAHAMSVLQPGDTLYLEDGTYTPNNNPGQPAVLYITVSGSSGNPITIKALNDGQAIVDGQQSVIACRAYQSYIEIDGINFRNSGGNGTNWGHGMDLSGSYITVRRCIVNGFGYNDPSASSQENNCAGINIGGSNDLLEDNAVYIPSSTSQSYGTPRLGINTWASNTVIRRNFIYWQPGGSPVGPGSIQVYGQSNDIVENNVIVGDPSNGGDGILVWVNTYNGEAQNNKVLGNVVMNTSIWGIWTATQENGSDQVSGTDMENNVLINTGDGFRNGGDNNQTLKNNTVVNAGNNPGLSIVSMQQSGYPGGYTLNTNAQSNSFLNCSGGGISAWGSYIGSTSEGSNNFYGTSANSGTGDSSTNPGYNTSTYGNGAYLMIPSALAGSNIGASVLYEYQNGTLTSTPLWPWPMESRIQSELGRSVTWASNGGIWQTLNGVNSSSSSQPSGSGSTSLQLVSPSNGQVTSTTVTFAWTKPGQGNPAGYKIWYSKNSDLSNGSLATVINSSAQAQAPVNSAFAGLGMGLLPFGIMFPAGIILNNKKKRLLLLATLLVAAVAFSSCGGGGGASGTSAASGGNTASGNLSTTVSGLASGTKYYWAVQTVDSAGHVTSQSSTGYFQTQ
ncbi:MAG: hypothetical protein M0Z52_09355 [Actinomycetota bacterium]|nr:hypothetical protein [Actinomycetota bacterium]